MSRTQPPRRWYREPWPWLLALPPLAAVAGAGMTLWLALATPNPMVRGDYGKSGFKLEQDLTRDRQALALGLVAELRLAPELARIEVELRGTQPAALTLYFWHPTRADFDRILRLARIGDRYRAPLPALPDDRWYLELEPEDRSWRLAGALSRGDRTATLAPEGS